MRSDVYRRSRTTFSWVAPIRPRAPARTRARTSLVQPVLALEHERRPGDIGEHRRHREAGDEHERHERPVAEQGLVDADGGSDAAEQAAVRREALRQGQGGHGAERHARDGEQPRSPSPLRPPQELPADVGASTGATPMTSMRRDRILATSEPLKRSRTTAVATTEAAACPGPARLAGRRGPHRRGDDAQERGHDVQRDPRQERATPPIASEIGPTRSGRSEPEQRSRERQLDRGRGGESGRTRSAAGPAGTCRS